MMDKAEAIKILESMRNRYADGDTNDAIDMAIESLGAEPRNDGRINGTKMVMSTREEAVNLAMAVADSGFLVTIQKRNEVIDAGFSMKTKTFYEIWFYRDEQRDD